MGISPILRWFNEPMTSTVAQVLWLDSNQSSRPTRQSCVLDPLTILLFHKKRPLTAGAIKGLIQCLKKYSDRQEKVSRSSDRGHVEWRSCLSILIVFCSTTENNCLSPHFQFIVDIHPACQGRISIRQIGSSVCWQLFRFGLRSIRPLRRPRSDTFHASPQIQLRHLRPQPSGSLME